MNLYSFVCICEYVLFMTGYFSCDMVVLFMSLYLLTIIIYPIWWLILVGRSRDFVKSGSSFCKANYCEVQGGKISIDFDAYYTNISTTSSFYMYLLSQVLLSTFLCRR